jgi:hypothetical protein
MSATDEQLTELPEPFPDDNPSTTPDEARTIFDQLRNQRRKIAGEHRLDLEVPGWGGQLVLRMGPIEPRRMKQLLDRARAATNDPEQGERYNADLIILATQEVVFRGTDGVEQVMADDHGPIGLDARLGEGLGLHASTAREVVFGLFDGANDRVIAIGTFAQRWIEWAQSADEEVDESFVGESNGSALSSPPPR